MTQKQDGTIPLTGAMSGVLAGLAGVTPASGTQAVCLYFFVNLLD